MFSKEHTEVEVTLKLRIDLKRVRTVYDDPSAPGVGLPSGSLAYLEIDDQELGEELYKGLLRLVSEHKHDSVKDLEDAHVWDGEKFLDDLDYDVDVLD